MYVVIVYYNFRPLFEKMDGKVEHGYVMSSKYVLMPAFVMH